MNLPKNDLGQKYMCVVRCILLCSNRSMEVLEKTFNIRPTDKAEVNNFVFCFLHKIINDTVILVS